MLSYFPQVRDEESTYSIFSRFQFALQPPDLRTIGKMLFDRNLEVGRLNFQSYFDYLCNNLSYKFTSERFLYENTIYPLFIPFISTEKQERALKYFKGNYPNKINACLQANDITNSRTYIRICRECIKEDFNIYGEPYYRRQHEIELNRLCYKHKIPLHEYNIFPYRIPRKYDDYYTVLSNSKEIAIPNKFREKLLNITDDINALFSSSLDNWDIKIAKGKISNRIAEMGYSTLDFIRTYQKLCEDFKKYYTEEFLDYIGYNFDVNARYSWIKNTISRKESVGDPIKYILIIRYLFGSFEEFYKYSKEYSTFKQGPYPCLNKVCDNYNKLVIKDIIQVNGGHGYPVATFECKHCGFKYSRRGPDKKNSDIYNKTYVIDYGHLWHDKLKEHINKGFGIRKISKLLGYKNRYKLKTLIDKYKNPNLINYYSSESIGNSDDLLIEQYRKEVLSLINENPNAKRQNITNKKSYRYLLRHDNEWVTNNLKSVKENNIIPREEKLKNYWLNKDDLMARKLLEVINKIKSEGELYRKINIPIIKKYTNGYDFYAKKDKLPKCIEILDRECETLIEYQKRRADYIMRELDSTNVNLTVSKVLRNANLRNSRVSKEVISYVEEKVKECNHDNIENINNK